MISSFFKNPITLWLRWLLQAKILEIKFRDKNLRVGYLTSLINTKIGRYNTFYSNITITNSVVGNYVYFASGSQIINAKFGNYCSIGPNVKIGLGKHPTHFISTFPAFFSTRKQCQISFVSEDFFEELGSIEVGNDVWIGANTLILDDIKIGDGAIVAAGAVVTKNVDPFTVVGGVPARPLKKRFSDEEIKVLLEMKWWNKDEVWIKKNASFFHQPSKFFENFRK